MPSNFQTSNLQTSCLKQKVIIMLVTMNDEQNINK